MDTSLLVLLAALCVNLSCAEGKKTRVKNLYGH